MMSAQLLVPLRAGDPFADDVFAIVDLPALAEHRDAVGVFVLDGEVIEDVAVALAAAGLPAADAGDGFHRVRADDPIHDVEVVDVLLDDVIAARAT